MEEINLKGEARYNGSPFPNIENARVRFVVWFFFFFFFFLVGLVLCFFFSGLDIISLWFEIFFPSVISLRAISPLA